MREGGVCVANIHVCTDQTRVGRKATSEDKIAEMHTGTKQEMELCEILEEKLRLDCRGNLGHEPC